MGRAPCCDKANVKRGPWSPEEDAKLKSYIEKHGTGGNWIALPQKIGLKRCGKSCRLRWLNYLRPNIKHGGFSEEEDNIICSLYISIGSRWSIIAAQLPGRTDNDIKNYWNTRLKKKLLGKHRKEQQAARRSGGGGSGGGGVNKRGSSTTSGNSSILPAAADDSNNNQNPYWPELPVLLAPLPNSFSNQQEPSFNDHASIRKLLIKLGGRFNSDDDHHQQPPIQDNINGSTTPNLDQFPVDIIIPSSTQQIYDHQQQSSAPVALSNISPHEFAQTHYSVSGITEGGGGGGGMHNMFQGQSSNYHLLSDQLKDMVYNNPQRLDGLEFLYGEDLMMMNERINSTTTYGESSIGWGEMLVCPPVAAASDDVYDQCMQRMMPQAQQCGFNGLISYPGVQ